jgi:hypothetical protein
VVYGQIEESLEVTEAEPWLVLVDIVILIVATVILDLLARRRSLTRLVPGGWRGRRGAQGVDPTAIPPGSSAPWPATWPPTQPQAGPPAAAPPIWPHGPS